MESDMPTQFSSTIKNRTSNAQTNVFNRAYKANAPRQQTNERTQHDRKRTTNR